MKVLKYLAILLTVAITSGYFFPFVLAKFPVANSKMILAVVGLVLFGLNLTRKENATVDRDFLSLSLWAFCISLISYLSMTINNTFDDEFTLYFMSMWVWLGGAYAVIQIIKGVHGTVSVPLVINYLIAVCVLQCILALVFDSSPSAETWCGETFAGERYMGNISKRMHGIGCSLDVAGFRFASVIVMAAFMSVYTHIKCSVWTELLYLSAICFISVVGSFLSRSTIIGTAVGFCYIIIYGFLKNRDKRTFISLLIIVLVATLVCIVLYNTDSTFKSNIRFGFEGFFSIFEKGKWETGSNNVLKKMVVWPDNLRTWIIGEGYINNPMDKALGTYDPYYIGQYYYGYYRGTDIGYLRYIFYFGIIGLAAFSLFFIYCCRFCIRRFPSFGWLFIMILAITFIQWLKVSTDLFVVFALFLCITSKDNKYYLTRHMAYCQQK